MTDPAEVIGRRIGAALLDLIPQIVLFVVLGLALGEGEAENGNASITLEGVEALYWFLLVIAYFMVCELAWRQTFGKRILGLRVVAEDGSPAGPRAIVIRNVLRVIDVLPFLYLLGLIVMLATPRKQRLGDLFGHTIVTTTTGAAQPPAGTGPPGGWGVPSGAAPGPEAPSTPPPPPPA